MPNRPAETVFGSENADLGHGTARQASQGADTGRHQGEARAERVAGGSNSAGWVRVVMAFLILLGYPWTAMSWVNVS
jgi:hypothetical protein